MSIWSLKSLLSVLLFASLLALAQVGYAQIETPDEGFLHIFEELEYIEDKARNKKFEDVRHAGNWQHATKKGFSKGYSDSAWWLKFDVLNPHKEGDWLLEIAYPVLDYLGVYIEDEDGLVRHLDLGDKFPFSQRPIEHRTFLVPLGLEQNRLATVYIRVASTSSVQVPLFLWERAQFTRSQSTESLLHGIIFGSLLIMAVFNLLVYMVLRDVSYIYYVSYIFCLALFAGGLYGWTFRYLWPTATRWNDQSILFFLAGIVLFATLFCWSFLDLKTFRQKWLIGWFKLHIALSPMFMIVSLITPYDILVRVLVPFGAISCGMGMLAGVLAWREGRPSARIYVIAWAFLFAGGIILALSKTGVLAQTLVTNYALQFGSVLETVLLSFALAQRINTEKTLRLDAQNELLDLQIQTKLELEERVAERKKELEEANIKLQNLSDTDQLSGLKNRRFFDGFLAQEFSRSFREKYSIGILLIDIDRFKSINDTYGHTVGDACIQAIAQALLNTVKRPADIVVRYGGEEFCVVLSQTDAAGTLHMANEFMEAVRSIHFPVDDIVLKVTCSIGCFIEVPSHPKRTKEFIDRADSALYEAKNSGRDRVVLYKNTA